MPHCLASLSSSPEMSLLLVSQKSEYFQKTFASNQFSTEVDSSKFRQTQLFDLTPINIADNLYAKSRKIVDANKGSAFSDNSVKSFDYFIRHNLEKIGLLTECWSDRQHIPSANFDSKLWRFLKLSVPSNHTAPLKIINLRNWSKHLKSAVGAKYLSHLASGFQWKSFDCRSNLAPVMRTKNHIVKNTLAAAALYRLENYRHYTKASDLC